MDIEYKDITEDDIIEELNEPLEDTGGQDFFEDIEDETEQDPFADENEAVPEVAFDSIKVFVDSFSSLLAEMFSAFTGQESKRYMPSNQQRKQLSKAIVQAFPRVSMSPGMALIIAFAMTYGPITARAIKDYRHAKSSDDNNTGYERNRQDNIIEADTGQYQ